MAFKLPDNIDLNNPGDITPECLKSLENFIAKSYNVLTNNRNLR